MTVWVCGGVLVLVGLVLAWGLCRAGALADGRRGGGDG